MLSCGSELWHHSKAFELVILILWAVAFVFAFLVFVVLPNIVLLVRLICRSDVRVGKTVPLQWLHVMPNAYGDALISAIVLVSPTGGAWHVYLAYTFGVCNGAGEVGVSCEAGPLSSYLETMSFPFEMGFLFLYSFLWLAAGVLPALTVIALPPRLFWQSFRGGR